MNRATINVSGADGSGSSVKIYETPDYEHPSKGARVMHGSFTVGPTSPDRQRIEVVELHMPYLDVRVKADDVRTELRTLYAALALKTQRDAGLEVQYQGACAEAFEALRAAVLGVVGRNITVKHIETIAESAFAAGERHGQDALRVQLRGLLGVAP